MGKKFFGALLSALLFGLLLHASAYAETAVVTGSDVNMREGPGTNFRIIGCLPAGAQVTVTDRSNGTWYGVEYNGATGFMSGNFLEVAEEEAAQPVNTTAQDVLGPGIAGYVNAMYVRFRSAPGSDYSVRGEYNRGKPLQYYFTTGDWAACIIDGVPGYLYADYVAFGTFDGYDGGNTGAQSETADDRPLNLRIMDTPTPEPAYRTPSPSDQLSLQHASNPDVEQIPGYINANYVRFRKGPGSSYPIIETYNAGVPVGVTGVYMDWTACLILGGGDRDPHRHCGHRYDVCGEYPAGDARHYLCRGRGLCRRQQCAYAQRALHVRPHRGRGLLRQCAQYRRPDRRLGRSHLRRQGRIHIRAVCQARQPEHRLGQPGGQLDGSHRQCALSGRQQS